MTKKVLQVIESAYRATVEEQDDTAVWMAHALKGAGADIGVLLRGNAVNYLVKAQEPNALSFGAWKQKHPSELAEDVVKLMGKGVEVYFVEEDAAERGLERTDFISGPRAVSRSGLPKLFSGYHQVWHW